MRARDYATFAFVAEMLVTIGSHQYPSNAQIRETMREMERMVKVSNDLAARTPIPFLRQSALKMRDKARDIVARLRAELNKTSDGEQ